MPFCLSEGVATEVPNKFLSSLVSSIKSKEVALSCVRSVWLFSWVWYPRNRVAEGTKVSEMSLKVANESVEPIQAQFNVVVEKMMKPIAA